MSEFFFLSLTEILIIYVPGFDYTGSDRNNGETNLFMRVKKFILLSVKKTSTKNWRTTTEAKEKQ